MSGTTISQGSTVGVYLGSATSNPVSITPNVTIGTTLVPAVGSQFNRYWTIVNAGTLISNGRTFYSDGIDLTSPGGTLFGGGMVTNLASGLIQGYDAGVYMAARGSLLNSGTISSTYQADTVVSNGSVVSHAGYQYSTQSGWMPEAGGVIIAGGGMLSNASSGLITSDAEAVAMGPNSTVQNAGKIISTSGSYGFGVVLVQDGVVSNTASGTISGGDVGVLTFGYTVVVNNAGLIAGQTNGGVSLNESGSVYNLATGTITGGTDGIYIYGTGALADNAGVVEGFGRDGVNLGFGGVTNAASGRITGAQNGVANGTSLLLGYASGVGGGAYQTYIYNHGTIIGQAGDGVSLVNGSYIENFAGARITGGNDGIYAEASATYSLALLNQGVVAGLARAGVQDFGAGYVSNATLGTIVGAYEGILSTGTAPVTIINDGLIQGATFAGVLLQGGGSVTNQSDAVIAGGTYGVEVGGGGAVQNAGSIAGIARYGVLLPAGGVVTNSSGGSISGGTWGVAIEGAAGSVSNAGTILAASSVGGAGVLLDAGGTLANVLGGTITSDWIGAQIGDATAAAVGAVYNDGLIVGSGTTDVLGVSAPVGVGVWLDGPAVITNAASGTISGGLYGINAYNRVTLVNQGSLNGGSYAFKAVAGFADRVIESPTASFTGMLEGGNAFGSSVVSTLELASGSSIGTIADMGSVQGFGVVALDAGATWSLGGSIISGETVAFGGPDTTLILTNPSFAAGATISGFVATDTIILAGVTNTTGLSLASSGLLTVFESGLAGPMLNFARPPALAYSLSGGGTDITVACFAEGTRIGTPGGTAAVEDLRPGMRVMRARGGAREIVWAGHRRIDCARHPRPRTVWPVLISPDAFGPGLPAAPLRLSPDHAVFVNDVLIPVRLLVNGATIRMAPVDEVTYYHIELPDHDLVLAEGLAVESYLDIGDRSNFAGGMPVGLFPDFSSPAPNLAAVWEALGCAPLVVHGKALEAARAMLNAPVRRMA